MVLVVDDHAEIRRALIVMLKGEGYEGTAVASGLEALEHLKNSVPHCIILDHRMPGMDGMGVLQAIRADPRLDKVNVILFSAEIRDELVKRAMHAGAQAVVQKGSLDCAQMQKLLHTYCAAKRDPKSSDHPHEGKDIG